MQSSIAIAERIKKLMEEKGISKSELIEKSKLSSTTINRLLDGSLVRILDTQIYIICRALDVPVQDFFHSPLFTLENLDDTRKIK